VALESHSAAGIGMILRCLRLVAISAFSSQLSTYGAAAVTSMAVIFVGFCRPHVRPKSGIVVFWPVVSTTQLLHFGRISSLLPSVSVRFDGFKDRLYTDIQLSQWYRRHRVIMGYPYVSSQMVKRDLNSLTKTGLLTSVRSISHLSTCSAIVVDCDLSKVSVDIQLGERLAIKLAL
jgi:hypothetical protein